MNVLLSLSNTLPIHTYKQWCERMPTVMWTLLPNTFAHTHTYTQVYMRVFPYVCVCLCVYVWLTFSMYVCFVCVYIGLYLANCLQDVRKSGCETTMVKTHIYVYVYTYEHIRTYTQINIK